MKNNFFSPKKHSAISFLKSVIVGDLQIDVFDSDPYYYLNYSFSGVLLASEFVTDFDDKIDYINKYFNEFLDSLKEYVNENI